MRTSVEEYDVVVSGGGPGGSTAATFIAMAGHRVLLLEKDARPFYKIGESLLPSTIHGICAMLGVSEELAKANFPRKLGGTFRWGKNKEPWTFDFAQSTRLTSPTSYAYQVERRKFDSILLDNAARKGVDVRERHTVLSPIFEGERIAGVNTLDDQGRSSVVRCRYVVDASGHTSTLNRHVGTRIYSKFFRNLAVFGYYLNGKRLSPPRSGNILCEAFDKGWMWFIPLSDVLTSVGAVIGEEYASILEQGRECALAACIQECGIIRDLLANATRASSEPYGEVRLRKDFSYCHDKFWRGGVVLVGDAACFIDPVFSSGVHLSTYSALLAARSINSCLENEMAEERAFGEFEKRYLREFRSFHDFLLAFYDLDQERDGYYWAARKVLQSSDDKSDAFIQLVSGISSREFGEQHERANLLFPAANAAAADMSFDKGPKTAQRSKFMFELLREGGQLQLQGTMGTVPFPQAPLFKAGLVPSPDGLHWTEPQNV